MSERFMPVPETARTSISAQSETSVIAPQETGSFPHGLLDELLDEAREYFPDASWKSASKYKEYDPYDLRDYPLRNFPLDERYGPLLEGGNPGDYRVVYYYEGRHSVEGDRYGTSTRSIGISTADEQKKEKVFLRELEYTKGEDGIVEFELGEYLNGSQVPIYGNEKAPFDPDRPRGDAKAAYVISTEGERTLVSSIIRRNDQVGIVVNGRLQEANWWRTLRIQQDYKQEVSYQDYFNIGLDTETTEGIGRVMVIAEGTAANPNTIHIGLGLYESRNPQPLMESRDGKVTVTVSRDDKHMVEFLNQFPEYQELLRPRLFKKITLEEAQAFLNDRAQLLQDHWRVPTNVIIGSNQLTG